MTPNKWVRILKTTNYPRLHLIGFPYAGGGASAFHPWARFLPPHVALCAVQYPGRETRINETPYTQMQDMLPDLVEALTPFLTVPTVFFGHSLGAMIAYETVKQLERQAASLPQHLFISAARAPHVPMRHDPYHILPGTEFWQRIGEMGGTPTAVLHHPEFKALLEPTLKADFAVAETYQRPDRVPVRIPLTVFIGLLDTYVDVDDVLAWKPYTTAQFNAHRIQAGHFFLQDYAAMLTSIILSYV